MSDDLVKRLRSLGSAGPGRISFLASEDAMKAASHIEKLEAALRRYRNETPLGNQPHMIAHEVDLLLEGKDD